MGKVQFINETVPKIVLEKSGSGENRTRSHFSAELMGGK
jgi:hypothetical protein